MAPRPAPDGGDPQHNRHSADDEAQPLPPSFLIHQIDPDVPSGRRADFHQCPTVTPQRNRPVRSLGSPERVEGKSCGNPLATRIHEPEP